MTPLALILLAQGYDVCGSDRSYDDGQTPDKFLMLQNMGVRLFPQDGCGLDAETTGVLVVSSAIEERIPDVKEAKRINVSIAKRAEVLSEIFHLSDCSIGISGTSGKTTVTGMVATMLHALDLHPTVMNGGRVTNLEDAGHAKIGSLLVGGNDYFVSEMDESDGSIDLFTADIAVLNNIELDHTSLDQLKEYFQNFVDRATRACVLNLDNENLRGLIRPDNAVTYSISYDGGNLHATDLVPRANGIDFKVNGQDVSLNVPGEHNVSNALAALGVAKVLGIDLAQSIPALEQFTGIKRRLETLGCSDIGVTVIDDFGHNPDKISASLATLKEFYGRLIVMFQPHGFAPLRMMGKKMAVAFGQYLDDEDILCIPEVYYAGGTVDRSVTSKDFVEMIKSEGVEHVHWFGTREEIEPFIKNVLKSGDRVIIMGARDDTLTLFAKTFL